MKAQSEFDLLGLFQRGQMPFRSNDDIARLPNMVWLYRRPILDYWAEHDETLGHIVRHVLIHEIGHHFGLSDADMEAIEADAGKDCANWPFAGPLFAIDQAPSLQFGREVRSMEKFTTLEGVAAPLKIINVDTDMIIPKQYL